MGMASQLLFTVIIALMKVAILMTYLRKCLALVFTYLTYYSRLYRHISVENEQVVLSCHDLLHRGIQFCLLLCYPIPVLVSTHENFEPATPC
jgi:hypothetical protein